MGRRGLFGFSSGGRISIESGQSINSQLCTLLHEVAHELLHKAADRASMSKEQMEIQAEGTAFVVSKYFNIENKSFNYLALWDADHNKIMQNLKAIAEASKRIIKGLAPHFLSFSA